MPARSFIDAGALWRRLKCEWQTKLLLWLVLLIAFSAPYLIVQRFPIRAPVRFEPSLLDRWIAFHPEWVLVYQSAYLLIPIAPFLSVRRSELRIYVRGFLLMTVLAMACYLALPVEGPRPIDAPRDGAYGILISYDTPLNTFPSLHVGLVAHSLAFGWWLSRGKARAALLAGTLWLALIAFSTLATKQHYAVDLPFGLLLGVGCQWWAARSVREAPAAAGSLYQRQS